MIPRYFPTAPLNSDRLIRATMAIGNDRLSGEGDVDIRTTRSLTTCPEVDFGAKASDRIHAFQPSTSVRGTESHQSLSCFLFLLRDRKVLKLTQKSTLITSNPQL